MSDRLTLTNAITEALVSVAGQGTASVDARVIRAQAERVASVIFDAIHDNVATKADVQAEIAPLRSEMHGGFARQDVAIERVRSTVREMESRLLVRMGGIAAGAAALLFAALHAWPPH
jgi:acetylornithine deacetylase/succinyl-diaminopimelate desuccinylase-like protein